MQIDFLSVARDEFFDAVTFYNDQREGLGDEFAKEVKRTLERIVQYPDAWHPLSLHTRRCRTNKFPYGIIYQIRSNTILIIAVMNPHREADSWENRIQFMSNESGFVQAQRTTLYDIIKVYEQKEAA